MVQRYGSYGGWEVIMVLFCRELDILQELTKNITVTRSSRFPNFFQRMAAEATAVKNA